MFPVTQRRMLTHQSSQMRKRRPDLLNRQILPIQFERKDKGYHSMRVIQAGV